MIRTLQICIYTTFLLTIAFFAAISEDNNSTSAYSSEFKATIPEPKFSAQIKLHEIQASDKKYVFFNNLDPWSYLEYSQYIEQSEFNDDFLYADFTDAFFAQNKITDFECAVFYLGSYPLNAATEGGIKVIDKIMEMYDAGKKLVIAGRFLLYAAYNVPEGNDAKVKNLFENVLGIQYVAQRRTGEVSGNTVTGWPYVIKGAPADPITYGAYKHCNIIYNGNSPLYLSVYADVFKINQQKALSQPIDYFTADEPAQRREDSLVGCIHTKDSSKIVFWSVPTGPIALPGVRSSMIVGALKWLFREAPGEGANIELLPQEEYDFGSVKPGDSAFADIIVRNSGTKNLTISKIYFEEWADPGIFTVIGGIPKTPITVKPEEAITIKIRFTPKEEKDYTEYLEFESNAVNGTTKGAHLLGKGGTGGGAKIQINRDSINFGEVGKLKQAFDEFTIKNTGDREVSIGIVEFTQNTDGAFNFPKGTPTPTLNPGQEQKYEIRFVPPEEGKTYYAKIRIWVTPVNPPEIIIPVIGIGSSGQAVINVSSNNINFDGVAKGQKSDKDFYIENTGNGILVVNSISLTEDDKDFFEFSGPDSFPFTIAVGTKYTFSVSFMPTEERQYDANMRIETNASNTPIKNIPLSGRGIISDVSDPKFSSRDISFKVVPNPIESDAQIIFDCRDELHASHLASQPVNIYIYDMIGTKVKNIYSGSIGGTNGRLGFNTKRLTKGVYFVVMRIGNLIIEKPVMVM